MKKERILLLVGNFYPEPTGIGKYNGEMIEWLAKEGHECTVVTTFPYYPHWKIQKPYTRRCYWFKTEKITVKKGQRPIKIIRCPHFIPKNPSGIYRVISEFSFLFTAYLMLLILLFRKKFNYVITVAPPFTMGLLGVLYKKLRGSRFIYHIQDLQIDAARHLDIIKANGVIKFFLSIEKFILNNADYVSTISEGMREKIKKKCDKEPLLFPNWVDTKSFYPIYDKASLKENYGFKATDTVVLYAGAIGHKQGLEQVLHSAKILQDSPDIKFAICGCGPYKSNLESLKQELNLHNVIFLPLQPFSSFNAFLNMADLHLVLQKKGASDLMLPSKLSTILSVGGVAIVTANSGTSLYNIINSSNTGILIEPEDQEALVAAITNRTTAVVEEKARNARKYAEANLANGKILNDYFTKVFNYEEAREVIEKEILIVNTERISKGNYTGTTNDQSASSSLIQ